MREKLQYFAHVLMLLVIYYIALSLDGISSIYTRTLFTNYYITLQLSFLTLFLITVYQKSYSYIIVFLGSLLYDSYFSTMIPLYTITNLVIFGLLKQLNLRKKTLIKILSLFMLTSLIYNLLTFTLVQLLSMSTINLYFYVWHKVLPTIFVHSLIVIMFYGIVLRLRQKKNRKKRIKS